MHLAGELVRSSYVLPCVLTVYYFGGRGGVDLIDAGQRDVLPPNRDVCDIIKGSLGLEGPIHQHVGVQAEHLQKYEVTACLEEVALNLCHVAQAETARSLVDDVEGHLREAAPAPRWEIRNITLQEDVITASKFHISTLRLTLRRPVILLKSYSKGVRRGLFPRCKSAFEGRTRFRQAGWQVCTM